MKKAHNYSKIFIKRWNCEKETIMKKKFLLLLFITLLISLIGCDMGSSQLSEEELLKAVIEPLDCLIECDSEMFGAKTDFDKDYCSIYKDSDESMLIIPQEDREKYTDYHDDPAFTHFYPVENFKTNTDVREYLEQYLSKELIDCLFHDDFLEYEGTLYMLRGDRGYGGSTYDKESLKYLGEENGAYLFNINYIEFDEVYNTELKLEKQEDKWILTSVRYLS